VLDWYQTYLVDTGRSPALWALIGFLVTYGLVRWITLRIRARNESGRAADGAVKDVYIGGVHIHHQVWGILLVLLTGLLEFRFQPDSPGVEVLATLFGVGAALALDEFALWLHVDDVYWSAEGRKSIDAVMIAVVVALALLMSASPLDVIGTDESQGLVGISVGILVLLSYTVVCLLKGKLATGLIGMVVPVISLVGSIRLAKPDSYWARRFYREKKMDRSRERFDADYEARRERLRDLMSGQRRRTDA
jgi:hypothetical protein